MAKNRSIISEGLRAEIVAMDRATNRPPMDVRLVKTESIKIQDRFRKDLGDIDGLATSIKEVGLINPITVLSDLTLVAGGRRLEAFKRLGEDEIPARIIESVLDVETALKLERDENIQRKDFTPSELFALMEVLLPKAEKAAAERKKAGRKAAPSGLSPQGQASSDQVIPSGLSSQNWSGRAVDQVAAVAGVSGKTVQRLKNIKKKGGTALVEAVRRGEISISTANNLAGSTAESSAYSIPSVFDEEWLLSTGIRVRALIKSPRKLTDEELTEIISRYRHCKT